MRPDEEKTTDEKLTMFLSDYMHFVCTQMNDTAVEVHQAMEQITEIFGTISKLTEEHKTAARRVLVRSDDLKELFIAVDSATLSDGDGGSASDGQELTEDVRRTGKDLKTRMENLEKMNQVIDDFSMAAMGFLSTDDIVAQRLNHVAEAMVILHKALEDVVGRGVDMDDHGSLTEWENDIKRRLKSLYTMVDEKEAYDRVFEGEAGREAS